jgi:hypothetical protein
MIMTQDKSQENDSTLEELMAKDENFRKVLAGVITVQDFFTLDQYQNSKNEFMKLYHKNIGTLKESSLYTDDNVAAAWITKLRYNENMTDQQFKALIDRSETIFKCGDGTPLELNLKEKNSTTPEKDDLCAMMWGIEALNGIQSFDSGATRIRLPEGNAPKIIQALRDAGAKPRDSTHATGTKLLDKGLGKDLKDEKLRAFTPRGKGALLIIPTSKDGTKGPSQKPGKNEYDTLHEEGTDYDLLLKREDYGYNDKLMHSRVHSKYGFMNYMSSVRAAYRSGLELLEKKSPLAKKAEAECQKERIPAGPKIHRKEHLTELKGQAAPLVSLLEAGKKLKEGSEPFRVFKTTWALRIKWPPFEKKIVSVNGCDGLGKFLAVLAQNQNKFTTEKDKAKLEKVKSLLEQALENREGPFVECREGNEVLVDCSGEKAQLCEGIRKNTKNSETNRDNLFEKGLVSVTNPDRTTYVKDKLGTLRPPESQESEVSQNKNTQEITTPTPTPKSKP